MDEPTIGLLASAVGLAAVITLIMNLLVRPAFGANTIGFDRLAPSIAVLIGVAFAVVYAVVTGPVNGSTLLQAVLVGIFGGALSQNVNNVVVRLAKE